MPHVEVGPATLLEVGAFYFGACEQVVLRIDGQAVAMGCVRAVGGRTWGMLDVGPGAKAHGVHVVRAAIRHIRERGETIYAVCAGPAAERLFSVIGFLPTGETVAGDKRVWRWTR